MLALVKVDDVCYLAARQLPRVAIAASIQVALPGEYHVIGER